MSAAARTRLKQAIACALIALGAAMIVSSLRPQPALDEIARPAPSQSAGDRDLRDAARRAQESAKWFDRVSIVNGALLIMLSVAWLVVRRPTAQPTADGRVVILSFAKVPGAAPIPRALTAAILLLALAVRLPGLGHSLWYDEIFTVQHYLTTNYRGIASDFSAPNNHILFSLALKTWDTLLPAALSGDARIIAWRMLSVAFGTLAVLGVGLLARETLGPRALLPAMLFFAVWPLAVDLSQQLRGYALVMALSAAATAVLFRLLRGRRGWIVYVLLAVAMLYTHPLALALLAGHVVAVAVARPLAMRRFASAFLVIAMIAAQLYAFLVPDALANAREQAHPQIAPLAPVEYLRSVARDIASRTGPPWASLPAALLASIGALALVRRASAIAAALALPPLVLITAGLAWPPLRETRFLPLVGVPFALCLIAGAQASLPPRASARRWTLAALGVYALIACAWGLATIYRWPIQSIRAAVLAAPLRATAVAGLGAPEATFYARMTKVFTVPDLLAVERSHHIRRVLVLYPYSWLAQPAQREFRARLESSFPKRKEFPGRLRSDPVVIEYSR